MTCASKKIPILAFSVSVCVKELLCIFEDDVMFLAGKSYLLVEKAPPYYLTILSTNPAWLGEYRYTLSNFMSKLHTFLWTKVSSFRFIQTNSFEDF